ncbi:hypothetical protein CBL_02940 [Carabus blaptoides fortunei]
MHSSLIGHNKKNPSSQDRDRGDEPELLSPTNQSNASSTSTGAHGEVTPLSQDSLPKSSDSISKRQSLQYSLDDSCKVISSFQEGDRKRRKFECLVGEGTNSNDFRQSSPKMRSETKSGTNSVSTMRTRPLTSNGIDIMLSMWQVRPLAVDMDPVADFSVKWMVSFFRVCQVRCVMNVQEAPESISPWSRIPQTETAK